MRKLKLYSPAADQLVVHLYIRSVEGCWICQWLIREEMGATATTLPLPIIRT